MIRNQMSLYSSILNKKTFNLQKAKFQRILSNFPPQKNQINLTMILSLTLFKGKIIKEKKNQRILSNFPMIKLWIVKNKVKAIHKKNNKNKTKKLNKVN